MYQTGLTGRLLMHGAASGESTGDHSAALLGFRQETPVFELGLFGTDAYALKKKRWSRVRRTRPVNQVSASEDTAEHPGGVDAQA